MTLRQKLTEQAEKDLCSMIREIRSTADQYKGVSSELLLKLAIGGRCIHSITSRTLIQSSKSSA